MQHRLVVPALLLGLWPVRPGLAQDTLANINRLTPRSVRTAYFALETAGQIRVTAVGGEPRGRSAVRRFLEHGVFQSKEERLWDGSVWPANAWILDARTREVIWELRTARTLPGQRGLQAFDGVIALPAGAYEVNYAALFPVSRFWTDDDDWRVRNAENDQQLGKELHGPYLDDGSYRSFGILVRGAGKRLTRELARAEWAGNAFVTLRGEKPGRPQRTGFELDRAMPVEVYLIGERENGWQDYGWIVDAATRKTVWTARSAQGDHAGGASKNRVQRVTLNLPAGKYLAGYVTDDSHHAAAWNETPPYDPSNWGLTVRVRSEADRPAARSFEYQPIRVADAVVSLVQVRNDELKWQRFRATRPATVQIFAVGEASGQDLVDYGWIVDESGRVVWKMTYDETGPAGGGEKNRVAASTLQLRAGTYTAYFKTDGSHSFGGGWNTTEPMDAEYWGITLASAVSRDAAALAALNADEPGSEPVLARLTRMRAGSEEEARFTLSRRSIIRLYAVGEGTREMVDYASIADSTGREVWRMTYSETEPAGGADKNRRVDRTTTFEPGTYTVRFRADDSHGWEDWNAEPPDDPLAWGVTVFGQGTTPRRER